MKKKNQQPNTIAKEYEQYLKMMNKDEKCYIKNRLIKQITWYDDMAVEKKNSYNHWMIVSIILTAVIPCLSLFTGFHYGIIASATIAIFSGASSAILSILNLCENQKLWVQYRTNCEILKSILHRYFTKSGEFGGKEEKERFELLIITAEEYLLKEFQTWTKLSQSDTKQEE